MSPPQGESSDSSLRARPRLENGTNRDVYSDHGFALSEISGGIQTTGGQVNIKNYYNIQSPTSRGASPSASLSPEDSSPSQQRPAPRTSNPPPAQGRKAEDLEIEAHLSDAITGFMNRGRAILRPDSATVEQRPSLDTRSQTEPNSPATAPLLERNKSAPGDPQANGATKNPKSRTSIFAIGKMR